MSTGHGLELEYKFRLGAGEATALLPKIQELGAENSFFAVTEDHYYFLSPGHFIRHRFDTERNELTCKEINDDCWKRAESTLRLSGANPAEVGFFLGMVGYRQVLRLHRESHVFRTGEWELVIYQVTPEGGVSCAFFEAEVFGFKDLDSARRRLDELSRGLGFSPDRRERRSLFQIFVGDEA